jgi:recombination DNA repair RAD52 pathway protein
LKKILLFGFLITNSLLAQFLPIEVSNYYGREYFPLNEKIELIYKSTVGESKRIIEHVDSSYILTIKADNFRYAQTYLQKDDGVYLTKTEQNVKILFIFSKHAEIVYSKPALQIKQPVKVGDKWKWKGYQVKNENDTTQITITGRAIAEEEIELPAGKFKTLKIEIIVANPKGQKTTFVQWLAKGLGSVKMNVKVEGHGLIQLAMKILGYDEVNSELKEIRYLE